MGCHGSTDAAPTEARRAPARHDGKPQRTDPSCVADRSSGRTGRGVPADKFAVDEYEDDDADVFSADAEEDTSCVSLAFVTLGSLPPLAAVTTPKNRPSPAPQATRNTTFGSFKNSSGGGGLRGRWGSSGRFTGGVWSSGGCGSPWTTGENARYTTSAELDAAAVVDELKSPRSTSQVRSERSGLLSEADADADVADADADDLHASGVDNLTRDMSRVPSGSIITHAVCGSSADGLSRRQSRATSNAGDFHHQHHHHLSFHAKHLHHHHQHGHMQHGSRCASHATTPHGSRPGSPREHHGHYLGASQLARQRAEALVVGEREIARQRLHSWLEALPKVALEDLPSSSNSALSPASGCTEPRTVPPSPGGPLLFTASAMPDDVDDAVDVVVRLHPNAIPERE